MNQQKLPEFKSLVILTSKKERNQLKISVGDNGCVMDEMTKQKMFEPFFTTKDVGSGTGLGMAISFGFVEEHNGMFKVESSLGEGSVISIYLSI